MKKNISKLLPDNAKLEITFTGKKLNSCFSIKDKTTFEHQGDLVYYVNCTNPSCHENYLGECGRRIIERVKNHSGRITDMKSLENTANFKIFDMNFSNNKRKRNIVESLWIKDLSPTLNV